MPARSAFLSIPGTEPGDASTPLRTPGTRIRSLVFTLAAVFYLFTLPLCLAVGGGVPESGAGATPTAAPSFRETGTIQPEAPATPPKLEVLKTIRGTVSRIVDGDTITVLDERLPLRIRLYGIDAPEKRQPYNRKAKEYLSDLCFGRRVRLAILDVDHYGRFIAEVFLEEEDDALLNHLVLAAGYAWHYKEYSADEEYSTLEDIAREFGFGLWGDPDLANVRVPPWIFRQRRRGSAGD